MYIYKINMTSGHCPPKKRLQMERMVTAYMPVSGLLAVVSTVKPSAERNDL